MWGLYFFSCLSCESWRSKSSLEPFFEQWYFQNRMVTVSGWGSEVRSSNHDTSGNLWCQADTKIHLKRWFPSQNWKVCLSRARVARRTAKIDCEPTQMLITHKDLGALYYFITRPIYQHLIPSHTWSMSSCLLCQWIG